MTADMDARLAIDTPVLFLYFVFIISIALAEPTQRVAR
jgi:hypothetical protein